MTEETQVAENSFRQRGTSRRFIIALIFAVGGTIGLFNDKIESEHYYWLAGAVLAGFAGTYWAKGKENKQ